MAQLTTTSEEQMQAACFQWFWNTYPEHRQMLFHVQQKAMNSIEGARFKAIGVVKGISDMIYIGFNSKVYFIELKLPNGVQSNEQIEFQHKVEFRGHVYIVIRSLEQFKRLMLEIM